MALLQVENLQKRFGNNQVLKSVSFSLEKGQVLAIIGSSGSGKTTLLRCLNFLETPDVGEIIVRLCQATAQYKRSHFRHLPALPQRSFYRLLLSPQIA